MARPLSTALPTEPTPDWMGPMDSGSLPASTSPSRNFTTFSPIFAVLSENGLNCCGWSCRSVRTMAAIFSLGQGMYGVPTRSRGSVMGIILA